VASSAAAKKCGASIGCGAIDGKETVSFFFVLGWHSALFGCRAVVDAALMPLLMSCPSRLDWMRYWFWYWYWCCSSPPCVAVVNVGIVAVVKVGVGVIAAGIVSRVSAVVAVAVAAGLVASSVIISVIAIRACSLGSRFIGCSGGGGCGGGWR